MNLLYLYFFVWWKRNELNPLNCPNSYQNHTHQALKELNHKFKAGPVRWKAPCSWAECENIWSGMLRNKVSNSHSLLNISAGSAQEHSVQAWPLKKPPLCCARMAGSKNLSLCRVGSYTLLWVKTSSSEGEPPGWAERGTVVWAENVCAAASQIYLKGVVRQMRKPPV